MSGFAAAACIAFACASVFLAENALRVPEHSRSPLIYAKAFARNAGSGVTAEDVQVTAPDGVRLSGWLFTPAHPGGDAAIVLHGVADTRTGVLGQARFLLAAGYTVLTPDSRGHGASGGEVATYGVREAADIHAWADLLCARSGVSRLYGLGQSMGGAILIESLAGEPRFRALAADCPFATFEEIAFDRLAQNGSPSRLLSRPLIELGLAYVRARYGVDLRLASPLDALRRSHTPVLLIHGMADDNIPIRHSRELHAAAPATSELWEVHGAGHVGSFGRDPEAYARRVLAHFAAHRELVPGN